MGSSFIHLIRTDYSEDVLMLCMGSPGNSDSKASACSAGDPGLIPGSGRSPGEGNGSPLQCSCLRNPMGRGAWGLRSTGSQRVGQTVISLSLSWCVGINSQTNLAKQQVLTKCELKVLIF